MVVPWSRYYGMGAFFCDFSWYLVHVFSCIFFHIAAALYWQKILVAIGQNHVFLKTLGICLKGDSFSQAKCHIFLLTIFRFARYERYENMEFWTLAIITFFAKRLFLQWKNMQPKNMHQKSRKNMEKFALPTKTLAKFTVS